MAAWVTVRGDIAKVVDAITITTPAAQSIKRVYQTPPASLQDFPCVVLYPPAVAVNRGSSTARQKTYLVRCLFVVSDADLAQAADLLDSFREAAIDAFDSAVSFQGDWTLVGQSIEEVTGIEYAGTRYTGFDCNLTVTVIESKNFTPYTP